MPDGLRQELRQRRGERHDDVRRGGRRGPNQQLRGVRREEPRGGGGEPAREVLPGCLQADGGAVRDGVGEARAGAARRPCPLLLRRPRHHGLPRQQGHCLNSELPRQRHCHVRPRQDQRFKCYHVFGCRVASL